VGLVDGRYVPSLLICDQTNTRDIRSNVRQSVSRRPKSRYEGIQIVGKAPINMDMDMDLDNNLQDDDTHTFLSL
jgi:hypothetical protein